VRTHKENGGWQQNSIQAAYLGLTEEARQMVVESFSKWDKNFRFPAFWGPNYDWTPDQDHGNVAMIALQRMLIQYENDKVILFPAWPGEWDVHFKVNAPDNTTVECLFKNGKVINTYTIPKKTKVMIQQKN
jgi:alpha-L-fucosidase 2